MIVRILGEGQFRVDDAVAAELNRLDADSRRPSSAATSPRSPPR